MTPAWGGGDAITIRGYTAPNPSNVAVLMDGIPLNAYNEGVQPTKSYLHPGMFNRVEMIRGPGSAIYGTDAFHGVLYYDTFASEEDALNFRAELSSGSYCEMDLQYSTELFSGTRLNAALAANGQDSQDLSYTYTETR